MCPEETWDEDGGRREALLGMMLFVVAIAVFVSVMPSPARELRARATIAAATQAVELADLERQAATAAAAVTEGVR